MQFVDFLLSEEAQSYFADETFEYPVVEGVVTNVEPPLAEIDEQAIGIQLSALADLEGTQDMLIDSGIIE